MPDTIIPQALRTGADKIIETSCAFVVLKGNEAFKLKKPVNYGFLDYSTVEKRTWALERELSYNRLTSDDIYRSVEIFGTEPVLRMRRFDDQAVLANRFDAQEDISLDLMEEIGTVIGDFHAKTDTCCDAFHAGNTAYVIGSNRDNIALFSKALGPELVAEYDAAIWATYGALEPEVRARLDRGFIRRCHGDLHLGNIVIEDQKPILFDCIEFNDRLIQIDILYDLAFILMDLWVRGQKAAANRVMNAWFETMARHEADIESLYAGLKLLPLFMSIRAAVRCHVNAHAAKGDATLMAVARNYLRAALGFLSFASARLMAIGGLSGSGKSYQARKVAAGFGRPAGAVIIRSDDVRKRLWGVKSHIHLPPEAYFTAHNRATLHEIMRLGRIILGSGQSLIIDATFRDPEWRRHAEALADETLAQFTGVWLEVDKDERLRRVQARENDISDADVHIAAAQESEIMLSQKWYRAAEVTV
jgi:hypothetical protein